MNVHIYAPRGYKMRWEAAPVLSKRPRRWCPSCQSLKPRNAFYRRSIHYYLHDPHYEYACGDCVRSKLGGLRVGYRSISALCRAMRSNERQGEREYKEWRRSILTPEQFAIEFPKRRRVPR